MHSEFLFCWVNSGWYSLYYDIRSYLTLGNYLNCKTYLIIIKIYSKYNQHTVGAFPNYSKVQNFIFAMII